MRWQHKLIVSSLCMITAVGIVVREPLVASEIRHWRGQPQKASVMGNLPACGGCKADVDSASSKSSSLSESLRSSLQSGTASVPLREKRPGKPPASPN